MHKLATAPNAQAHAGTQVTQAVTTPLSDLKLVRAEIPAVLAAAQKAPYAVPAERSCEALGKDIQALDAVLGADLDTQVTGAHLKGLGQAADCAAPAAPRQ